MTKQGDEESHKTKQPWRSKIMLMAALAVVFVILVYSIVHLFRTGENPLLMIALIVVLLIMIPVSIFSVDTAFYHYSWNG